MAKLGVFVDPDQRLHDPGPGMPDGPARVEACMTALNQSAVELEVFAAIPASDDDLLRVHTKAYIDRLREYCRRGGGWIDPDTPVGPDSFQVAKRAAGACIGAVRRLARTGERAFCLVRPPGHHATAETAMGFCLINNVAVAAAAALAGRYAERVAIVDFDVHHGNGTQAIFWQEPNILYASVHQWPWYPWVDGDLSQTGGSNAEGLNVNIPLAAGCGDAEHLAAMEAIVAPVVRSFRPDLLLVSAGYDAHSRDGLSSQLVSSQGFGAISQLLHRLAEEVTGGKIIFVLEGGYDLEALSESVVSSTRALAGAGFDGMSWSSGYPAIDEAAAFHKDRWKL